MAMNGNFFMHYAIHGSLLARELLFPFRTMPGGESEKIFSPSTAVGKVKAFFMSSSSFKAVSRR
jgi:hypothetical protein